MNVLDELTLDVQAERDRIVRFIREQMARAGFTRGLLGVSGGLDSALVCYLAVEALGAGNVLGLLLPYRGSNPDSERDAMAVINALGMPHRKIPITPMVEPVFATSPDMSERRRGNIMARMRMIVWYDQSEEFGGLVLGTSNRTEWCLGYFTMHGDTGAAMRPIAHLWKCQVRQLARAVGVPAQIVAKAPSADLWAGQTDEGELGFTYDEADQVLHLHLDRGYSEEQIATIGFAPGLVRRILKRMRQTEFKRIPPPVPALPALLRRAAS